MTVEVDVQIATRDASIPAESGITDWIQRAMAHAGCDDGEVSLRIVDSAEMQSLNHQFRGKNSPTNVLSFAAEKLTGLPATFEQPIGDIVVCASVVGDEAKIQHKDVADHWAHIVIHGALHLLGHDHQQDDDAFAMESLEIEILAGLDIANPYQEAGQ